MVLFDRIYYIAPKNTKINFQKAFGDALVPLKPTERLIDFCSKEAHRRIWKSITIAGLYNIIGLIPRTFWTGLLDESTKYLVFQGLGVKGKYSNIMKQLFFHKEIKDNRHLDEIFYEICSELYEGGRDVRFQHKKNKYPKSKKTINSDDFIFKLKESKPPYIDFSSLVDEKEESGEGDSFEYPYFVPHFAMTKEMRNLTIKLLWLFFRTHYYLLIAEAYNISYSPHTLRSPLLEYGVLSHKSFTLDRRDFRKSDNIRKEIIDHLKNEAITNLDELKNIFGTHFLGINLPPVFTHILSKTNKPDDIINQTYLLRNSKPVSKFRDICNEIYESVDSGKIKYLTRIKREIGKLYENLNIEYGFQEPKESINLKIGYGPFSFSKKIKIPRIFYKQFFLRKHHLVFLRNIYSDLIRVSRLGKTYDKLFLELINKNKEYN